MQTAEVDCCVFGGGIAGLWTLGRLLRAGYSAVLLEGRALGGVQTLASQGIIHGGTKYALTGKLSGASRAIGAMPAIWRACLAGTGELDLAGVRVLADHQCLWSTGGLASEMTGFLASRAMRSRVQTLGPAERPAALRDPRFTGHVYRLDEPVLDTASLVAGLARQYGQACLRLDPEQGLRLLEGKPPTLELSDPQAGRLRLRARRLVLTAGAGNERLLSSLGRAKPAMQRRPLHMLMARGPLPPLYAHCLGAGSNPRITVTSHPLPDGDWVWYIGGQIAESGVERPTGEQIAAGRRELLDILPWLDLSATRFAGYRVDRAEPRQPGGLRPDRPFLQSRDGVSVAWPTKLAFAPALAAGVIEHLERDGVAPGGPPPALDWPRPALARLPWEEVREWS